MGREVGGCARGTGPDQATPRVVDYVRLRVQEFILEGRQGRVVELELPLEGAIGQASATLEHRDRLVEDLLKSHRPPSRGRCGVQKTVWEWDRPFGRMYTAPGCQKKAGSPGST